MVWIVAGPCALCGRDPALGHAQIGDDWYCHADEMPSCFEQAQVLGPLSFDSLIGTLLNALGRADGPVTPEEWERARSAHAEHVRLALSGDKSRAAFEWAQAEIDEHQDGR